MDTRFHSKYKICLCLAGIVRKKDVYHSEILRDTRFSTYLYKSRHYM